MLSYFLMNRYALKRSRQLFLVTPLSRSCQALLKPYDKHNNHTLMKTCVEKSSTNNRFNYGSIKKDLEFGLFDSFKYWIRGTTSIYLTWLNIIKMFCWFTMYHKYLWTRGNCEVELLTRRLVKENHKRHVIIMSTRVTECQTK